MKRTTLFLAAALLILPLGCKPVQSNTPPAALAPGYLTPADQTLGASLAAVNGFVVQEKLNYSTLSTMLQLRERPYLNDMIGATDLANASYQAYHAGSQTLGQAQAALTTAQNAETALAAEKGIK